MTSQPLYVALDQTPAYALRYSWSGWRNGYYAGTFGEYDMNAIRVQIEQVARSRCLVNDVNS